MFANSYRFPRWFSPAETTPKLSDFSTNSRVLLLSAMALAIGVIASFVASALLWLIAVITNLAFFHRFSSAASIPADHHLGAWVILVPVAGALCIGLMARFGSEKIRGHGIPEALEAILLGRSRIQLKVAILKPLSSAISIGTGGPFGAEGPIIMTGGAFGSLFAQQFHLSAGERKTLLVAGAAAGMSAVFATPIAAVLLAVELLLFEWKPRSLIPVTIAALTASVMRVPLLGSGPLFPVVMHAAATPSTLLYGLCVGLVAGLVSGLLTTLVYGFEDAFQKLKCHWMWWPALGALVVGLGGWLDPRVLGVGYGIIHDLLRGEIGGTAIAGFLVVKALIWAVALGSGTSGGVLAPLLIIGGCLGSIMGVHLPAGDAGLWAMTGMTAMMGGTMRSPLTALVFTAELTHDYNTLPVLMAGCIAALAVTVLWMPRSILTEKLARRGQHIIREYSVDPFELARVGEVMDREFPSVPGTMTVAELSDRLSAGDPQLTRRQGIVLLDQEGQLAGIVTRNDIVKALRTQDPRTFTVLSATSHRPVVAFPDESLHTAIKRMLTHDIGRLPVVDRGAPGKVIGYLGRAGILAARVKMQEEEDVFERGHSPTTGGH